MLSLCASFALASALATLDGTYKLPPPEIVQLLDAPSTPQAIVSPAGDWLLFVERPAMPTIAEVTRPWIPLAGSRIDPALNATQQLSFATQLSVQELRGKTAQPIELPAGARIMDVRWSHLGGRFAFTLATDHGVELWLGDASSRVTRKLASGINAVFGAGFDWLGDGVRLLVTLVPRGRGPAPADVSVPSGPAVQETSGAKTALRTYQDLLANAHDEQLFAYYGTSQIAFVDPRAGEPVFTGAPGLYLSVDASPDDEHLLVTRLERPFSYVLPASLFPQTIEVWNTGGGELEHVVARVPMGENIPQEGVRTGPRNVTWHAALPATLVWAEAQDGGDPKTKAEWRDQWFALDAPFQGGARTLAKLHQRAQGLTFFPEPERFLANEYDRDRRWTRQLAFDTRSPGAEPSVWDDRSANDRYGDPGQLATRVNARGRRVLRTEAGFAFRSGRGASPDGERPFVDRVELATRKSERAWRCGAAEYESVVAFADGASAGKPVLVTSRESPTSAPNYFWRELASDAQGAITAFPDPQPALRGITQELVKYKRADGVELSATLYLPPRYAKGTRLPLVVWAYPQEFNDASTAGQVTGSAQRFVRVRGASHLFFLLHGYAVLDNAAMPIVGDPETMNDTFLPQIVASAQAAIDFAVERGVADRQRVGVGGHSYGAFMTANLLAHCDLFRAGIARSGAYNRTLTPFGFQSERRTIWEAPKPYLELSPFLAAQKIDEPLLMIHGEKDSNQGTFPIQSERMYQAIKGNGGTARLVILPGEAHGYSARESVLHTVAEMFEWFDRFVRDAQPRTPKSAVEAAGSR